MLLLVNFYLLGGIMATDGVLAGRRQIALRFATVTKRTKGIPEIPRELWQSWAFMLDVVQSTYVDVFRSKAAAIPMLHGHRRFARETYPMVRLVSSKVARAERSFAVGKAALHKLFLFVAAVFAVLVLVNMRLVQQRMPDFTPLVCALATEPTLVL